MRISMSYMNDTRAATIGHNTPVSMSAFDAQHNQTSRCHHMLSEPKVTG